MTVRDHSRGVCLQCDDDHVVHQFDGFFARDSFGGRVQSGIRFRRVGPLRLAFETLFNLSHAREIFVELFAIMLTERLLHGRTVQSNHIQDALLLSQARVQFFARIAGVSKDGVEQIDRPRDSGNRIATVIPRKRQASPVARIGTAVLFIRRQS